MQEFRSIMFSNFIFVVVFLFLIFVQISLLDTGGEFLQIISDDPLDIDFLGYLSLALSAIILIMSKLFVPYIFSSIILVLLFYWLRLKDDMLEDISEKSFVVWTTIIVLITFVLYCLSHIIQFMYLMNDNCMCIYYNAELPSKILTISEQSNFMVRDYYELRIEQLQNGELEEGADYAFRIILSAIGYAVVSFFYFPVLIIGSIGDFIKDGIFIDLQMRHMRLEDVFNVRRLFMGYAISDFFYDDMVFDNIRTLTQENSSPKIDKVVLFWESVRAFCFGLTISFHRFARHVKRTIREIA